MSPISEASEEERDPSDQDETARQINWGMEGIPLYQPVVPPTPSDHNEPDPLHTDASTMEQIGRTESADQNEGDDNILEEIENLSSKHFFNTFFGLLLRSACPLYMSLPTRHKRYSTIKKRLEQLRITDIPPCNKKEEEPPNQNGGAHNNMFGLNVSKCNTARVVAS